MKKVRQPRHWFLLLFACLIMFGNYYCYDIPGAINKQLHSWLGSSYDDFQFQLNLLYSVYSLPNIFLPLVGGYLVDRLGSTKMVFVFSTLICLGSAIFAYGITNKIFTYMLLGRFVFGLGGECLEVAQSRITTDWFKGRGLAMALGFNLSSARIATALNDVISPYLEHWTNVSFPAWFGFAVCCFSYFCALFMIYLNRPASRILADVPLEQHMVKSVDSTQYHIDDETVDEAQQEKRRLLSSEYDEHTQDTIGGSSSNSLKDFNSEMASTAFKSIEEYDEQDETVHLSQIWSIGKPFWLLCATAILLYGSVVPFFHICTDFFQHKWFPNDPRTAGLVMSFPDFISAIGSPICGIFVDRFGRRITLMQISGAMIILSHALFCFTTVSPFITIAIMGISYSIFAAALWPCVPYLVGCHQIATAYGLVTVALNISLFSLPLVVAKIRTLSFSEAPNGFDYVEYFFMACAVLGVICVTFLKYIDNKQNGCLELNSAQIRAREEEGDSITNEEDSPVLEPIPDYTESGPEETGTSDILDIVPRTTIAEFESNQDQQLYYAYSSLSYKQKYFFLNEENKKKYIKDDYHQVDNEENEDENMIVKVIAEGIAVTAPQTIIHHRHRCKLHPKKSPSRKPQQKQQVENNPPGATASTYNPNAATSPQSHPTVSSSDPVLASPNNQQALSTLRSSNPNASRNVAMSTSSTNDLHSNHHDLVCDCAEDNGGLTDDERAHWEKKVRKNRLKNVRKYH